MAHQLKQGTSRKWLTLGIFILCAGLFFIFFYKYFIGIEKYILSHEVDWLKELQYYQTIQQQVFQLHQFPHCSGYENQGTYALFANPETSVLTPVNLLLPLVSRYHFFIYHMAIHYLAALIGFVLLCRLFHLPLFSILLMFVVYGFNGRVVSNYLVAHTVFITYMWLPLLLYFYLSYFKGDSSKRLFHALGAAVVLTMIFFEGGVHLIVWLGLFFCFDAVLFVVFDAASKKRIVVSGITPYMRFLIIIASAFLGLSAVKLLPVLSAFGTAYAPDPIEGYQSVVFFLQTFYQYGLGPDIPYKELWMEEAYNFIGHYAFALAMAAIAYALFISKDWVVKRMALVLMIFIALSFGYNYFALFGKVPVLKAERVGSRFVFISILMLTVLIPVFLHALLSRLNIRRQVQEMLFLILSVFIFVELFLEGLNWMYPVNDPFELDIYLPPACQLPANYAAFFYAGIIISMLSAAALAYISIFAKKRRF